MAAPTILETYPANNDTGIPVGIQLTVTFDRGIDLTTAQQNIVLYGPDRDYWVGPESIEWVDKETGNNPFLLSSPTLQGQVECLYTWEYVDTDGTVVDPTAQIDSLATEQDSGFIYRLRITPTQPLAASADYKFVIIGGTDRGIVSRTVWDTVPDSGNVGTDGEIQIGSTWTGADDILNVKIEVSGDIGTAKYKYWFDSETEADAVVGRVTSRKFRKLREGIQIRFQGSGYVINDIYTVSLSAQERLAANYEISFQTNDGTFSVAPDSPSTPATSQPPSSTMPSSTVGPGTALFDVVSVDPEDGSTNLPITTRTITVEFSEAIDPTTITQDSVKVWAYPITGVYSETYQPILLARKLTVDGTTLTIEV